MQNNLFVVYNDPYITEFQSTHEHDIIYLNFSDRMKDDSLNCKNLSFGQITKELFDIGAHTYWFISNRIKDFDFKKTQDTLNEFKCNDVGTISYNVNPTIIPFNYYKCKSYKTGMCEVPLCDSRCFITRREILAKSSTVNASPYLFLESIEYVISHFTKSLNFLNIADFNKSVKSERILNINYSSVMNKIRNMSLEQNLPDMINLIDSISRYAYENNNRNCARKINPVLLRPSKSS